LITNRSKRRCPVCDRDVKKGVLVCRSRGHDFRAAAMASNTPTYGQPPAYGQQPGYGQPASAPFAPGDGQPWSSAPDDQNQPPS
jgi:hypothetical protein